MGMSFTPTVFKKKKSATITVNSDSSLTGYTLSSVTFTKRNGRQKIWSTGSLVVGNPSTSATIAVNSADADEDDGVPRDAPTPGDLTVNLADPHSNPTPISEPVTLDP